MKIKGIKESNIYYDALMYLYSQATKDMGNNPTDDIDLAFDTIDELINDVEKKRRKAEQQYKIDSKLIGLYETKILKLEQMLGNIYKHISKEE